MKRKVVSLLLALVLVLSLVPLPAAAQGTEGTFANGISWELNGEGILRISGSGSLEAENGALPWDNLSSQIEQVIIEEGICILCDDAFADCTKLVQVDLPGSLLSIGVGAFSNCVSLETVLLQEGVIRICDGAFAGCENLTYISFPESLKIIGEEAFMQCTSLNWVRFPWELERIECRAFYESGIVSVEFDGTPLYIGEEAFYWCDNMESAIFPDTAPEMGPDAFEFRTTCYFPTDQDLSQYDVRARTERILRHYEGVLEDGTYWTFFNSGLLRLEGITALAATAADFSDFADEIRSVEVMDGVTALAEGALSGFETAYQIRLPYGLSDIGDNAFSGCTALREMNMPWDVVTIGAGAFRDCTALRKLNFWGDCPQIDSTAFENVSATVYHLDEMLGYEPPVELPGASLTWDIVRYSSANGGILGSDFLWYLDDSNCLYIDGEGPMPEGNYDDWDNLFPWTTSKEITTSVVVGDNITSISQCAFDGFVDVISVELPDTLTQIGASAFNDCQSLRSIQLPEGLTELDINAFARCSGLERLTLPTDIKVIPDYCFTDCGHLVEIILPEKLEVIGEQAFDACYELGCLVFPETLTEIRYWAFSNTSELHQVTFTGDAPVMGEDVFIGAHVDLYYPSDRSGWTEDVMLDYGAWEYQWIPYDPVEETCRHTWSDGACSLCTAVCTHHYIGNVCGICGQPLDPQTQCLATLTGSFNNWSTEPNMILFEDDTLYASMELEEGSYLFKILYDGVSYGVDENHSSDYWVYNSLVEDGYTCRFEIDHAGTYELHFDMSSYRPDLYYIPETMYVMGTEGVFGTKVEMIPYGKGYYYAETMLEKGVYSWVLSDEDGIIQRNWTDYNVPDLSKVTTSINIYNQWSLTRYEPVEDPVITPKYPTLSFEDEITMNVYFEASKLGWQNVDDMGLICFDTADAEGTIETASAVIEGAVKDAATGLYMVRTDSIPAKDLSKTKYFKIYVQRSDGSYVYSSLLKYSPLNYAASQFGDSTAPAAMKALVTAMLCYGGAAQRYFGTDDAYADANLTEEQKAYIESYRSDMMNPVVKPDAAKLGSFGATETGFARCYPTISFEGAFAINYYFLPEHTVEGDVTFYYWDRTAYEAADTLTVDNATGSQVLTYDETGLYNGAVENIAAKDLDDTIYVAAVYSDGTTRYCSGVLAYSIGDYCVSQAKEGKPMESLAAATAVYGYYAKQYFAE